MAAASAMNRGDPAAADRGKTRKLEDCSLFDSFVCPREQSWRDGKSQCFGRFEVHNKLKLRRLLNRKLCRPGTLEDTIYIVCKAPVTLDQTRSVGTNRAALGKHRPAGNHRRAVACCELDDPLPILD